MDKGEAKNILARVVGGATHPSYTDIREACRYALDVLNEPSLPSDVDEAAETYASDYPAYNDEQAIAKYAFKRGAEWQKAKMMKDAVEGEVVKIFPEGAASVHYQPGFGIGEMAYFCKADGLNDGDKVRIVALKAEE